MPNPGRSNAIARRPAGRGRERLPPRVGAVGVPMKHHDRDPSPSSSSTRVSYPASSGRCSKSGWIIRECDRRLHCYPCVCGPSIQPVRTKRLPACCRGGRLAPGNLANPRCCARVRHREHGADHREDEARDEQHVVHRSRRTRCGSQRSPRGRELARSRRDHLLRAARRDRVGDSAAAWPAIRGMARVAGASLFFSVLSKIAPSAAIPARSRPGGTCC